MLELLRTVDDGFFDERLVLFALRPDRVFQAVPRPVQDFVCNPIVLVIPDLFQLEIQLLLKRGVNVRQE